MLIATELRNLLQSGVRHIGELVIQTNASSNHYTICHIEDIDLSAQPCFGGLELFKGPSSARDLATHDKEGAYRFSKAETNLKRGWVMILENEEHLRQALDQFYPACLGLFLALQRGTLETQNLRDKLDRQTGMYRFARTISDTGAQQLVRKICGPVHRCAKRILWQIDANTPLEDSDASRFNGIPSTVPENEAIPLLCREACNHFVSECRQAAKAEVRSSE